MSYTTNSSTVIGVGGTINSSSGQISGFASIAPNSNPSNLRIIPSQPYSSLPHNVQLQSGSVSGPLQYMQQNLQNNVTLTPLNVHQNYVIPTQVYLQQRHVMEESSPMHHSEGSGSGVGPPEPAPPPENRLKVEDALNYLDQVKYKFSTQPQVYNDFLDIMKEFKSQSIDTPGVIARVSNLFQGHPELIVGFNTFLPPGFKVEISYGGAGQNQGGYTVTTVQTDPQGGPLGGDPHPAEREHVPLPRAAVRPPVVGTDPGRQYNGSNSRVSTSPPPSQIVCGGTTFECIQLQHPPTGAEFNHAVNYVNKIKNRFNEQPEKYKQFLDILQLYQKEKRSVNKHLTEQEVFAQMAKLFENQEDLLQEFRQFLLPEAHHNQNMTIKSVIDQAKETCKLNGDKPIGGRKKPVLTAAKRRAVPKQGQGGSAARRRKSSISEPVTASGRPELPDFGNSSEIGLFEKIRNAMSSAKYEDFLRSLKLHNEGVINRSELLSMVKPALSRLGGNNNYFQTFKEFLSGHSDEEQAVIAPKSPPERTKVSKQSELRFEFIDGTNLNRIGTSYVELPKDHYPLKSSGRTELDVQVLNETWQLHPPQRTEPLKSTKGKKHDADEFEFMCEDERFELDMIMEPNAAAIRGLEATVKRMSRMTPEELKVFKLDETLGGKSEIIYQKAIRLIYGEDMGPQIIEAMRHAPSIAIPIILRRLKDKDREWRTAQKGFNQMWREQLEKFASSNTLESAVAAASSGKGKSNDAKEKASKIAAAASKSDATPPVVVLKDDASTTSTASTTPSTSTQKATTTASIVITLDEDTEKSSQKKETTTTT